VIGAYDNLQLKVKGKYRSFFIYPCMHVHVVTQTFKRKENGKCFLGKE